MSLRHDFEERAAIMEFDGGLPRGEAERMALADLYHQHAGDVPPGVLGELIAADRRRRDGRIAAEIASTFGHVRFPWGFGWVVAEGATYRPADRDEPAATAFIVPAVSDGCIVDLVAQSVELKGIRSRLGVASVVGLDDIEAARTAGQPVYVFASLPEWLRGGGRGVVVVDWERMAQELDGVPTILCSASISDRLYRLTRRCISAPVVAIPANKEARHVA